MAMKIHAWLHLRLGERQMLEAGNDDETREIEDFGMKFK